MNQEDYNDIMKHPCELFSEKKTIKNKRCPSCNEKYLGDGINNCIDCEIEKEKGDKK